MSKKGEALKMSFEEALQELEAIVSEMEGDQLSLDESMKAFERGVALSAYCSKKIDEAEGKIMVLMKDGDSYSEKSFVLKEEA